MLGQCKQRQHRQSEEKNLFGSIQKALRRKLTENKPSTSSECPGNYSALVEKANYWMKKDYVARRATANGFCASKCADIPLR